VVLVKSIKSAVCQSMDSIDPVRSKSPEATADTPLASRTSNGVDNFFKIF